GARRQRLPLLRAFARAAVGDEPQHAAQHHGQRHNGGRCAAVEEKQNNDKSDGGGNGPSHYAPSWVRRDFMRLNLGRVAGNAIVSTTSPRLREQAVTSSSSAV